MRSDLNVDARKQMKLRRFIVFICFVGAALIPTSAQSLPQVHLEARGLAPRPIEELTETAIVHCYASAWNNMAAALESGEIGRLDDEFVGFAKERLVRRIKEQNQTGVHVRTVDHGHQLNAAFYAADGSAMQLLDRVHLEIQTFDGQKLIATQDATHNYVVLMTPGADRWYLRDLEEVPSESVVSNR